MKKLRYLLSPHEFSDTDAHCGTEGEPQPWFCHSAEGGSGRAHGRAPHLLPTGVIAFRSVQVLGGAVGVLAMKNEARTNRDAIFHERAVVNEYAVREGDEFSDSVGDSVVERVVHFGAFDYAVGAGREAYGTQNPE